MTRQEWRRLARRIHTVDQRESFITAIKSLRNETGYGIIEAKRAVERLRKVDWKNV